MKLRKPISSRASEHGAALVEAAVALPMFLGVVFASFHLLVFCFQMLRFQYDVAESTRETFTTNSVGRGGDSWQSFLSRRLANRSADLYLPAWNLDVTFSECTNGWACAPDAQPGQSVALVFSVTQAFGLGSLGGISVPDITFKTKSIAVIQMAESE
jgi:hypothetical protein